MELNLQNIVQTLERVGIHCTHVLQYTNLTINNTFNKRRINPCWKKFASPLVSDKLRGTNKLFGSDSLGTIQCTVLFSIFDINRIVLIVQIVQESISVTACNKLIICTHKNMRTR